MREISTRRQTQAKQEGVLSLQAARTRKAVKDEQLAHIRSRIRLAWRVLARLSEQEAYWKAL